MSENIRQKSLTIPEYFEAYVYRQNHGKYMHRNIPESLIFFVRLFPILRLYFWGYRLC